MSKWSSRWFFKAFRWKTGFFVRFRKSSKKFYSRAIITQMNFAPKISLWQVFLYYKITKNSLFWKKNGIFAPKTQFFSLENSMHRRLQALGCLQKSVQNRRRTDSSFGLPYSIRIPWPYTRPLHVTCGYPIGPFSSKVKFQSFFKEFLNASSDLGLFMKTYD